MPSQKVQVQRDMLDNNQCRHSYPNQIHHRNKTEKRTSHFMTDKITLYILKELENQMEAVEVYGTSMNRIKRNKNMGCLCIILQYPQDHELRWQPK